MDRREYLRIVQFGNVRELVKAIRFVTDCKFTTAMIDHKIDMAKVHKPIPRRNKKPKFFFGPRFFAKLRLMPAVSVEVNESRSQLRKTCYGFRDKLTNERVYLRIDPGSLLEVRDSHCGYLMGTRYLVPNIDRMKSRRWDKLARLISRILSREGIIVSVAQVDKYKRSTKPRAKLAKRIMMLRAIYVKYRIVNARQAKNEKAKQQVSIAAGFVRDVNAGGPTGPKS